MNKVNPKVLLQSKWTKVEVKNKEKHFIITRVSYDENQLVTQCIIEAVISKSEYKIDWRELKQPTKWRMGWQ
ncbi:TIGR02450 family Trp-rich protein [Colwelliaceae bacterium 6441]